MSPVVHLGSIPLSLGPAVPPRDHPVPTKRPLPAKTSRPPHPPSDWRLLLVLLPIHRPPRNAVLTHLNTLGVRAQQAGEPAIQAGGVHVAAPQDRVGPGRDGRLVVLGRDAEEGLFDRLVGIRLGAVERLDFFRDGRESRVGRVAQVVVVEQAGVALLDELGVGPAASAWRFGGGGERRRGA